MGPCLPIATTTPIKDEHSTFDAAAATTRLAETYGNTGSLVRLQRAAGAVSDGLLNQRAAAAQITCKGASSHTGQGLIVACPSRNLLSLVQVTLRD